MKKGTLILLIAVMVYSCKEKEPPPAGQSECPECNLIKESIIVLSGDTVNLDYEYENGLLVKSPFHTFTYNEEKEVEVMRVYDSQNDSFLTSVKYQFENGLLKYYTNYDLSDGTISSSSEYFYANEALVYIKATEDGQTYELDIESDDRNNPIIIKYVLIDGVAPSPSIEVRYEYDNNCNPYYRRPGFIESFEYFSRNNSTRLISIIGHARDTIESKFEYLPNGYISKKENQGLTTYYTYDCL